MKKLTKTQVVQKSDLASRSGAEFTALDLAITAYNNAMTAAWEALAPALQSYNECMAECTEWQQEVRSAIEEYVEGRSEKWQESDAATAYSNWLDELNIEFEQIEIEEPQEIDFNPENYEELIEQIAEDIDTHLG